MKPVLPRVVVFLMLGMLAGGLLAEVEEDERLVPKVSPSKAFVCSIGKGPGGSGNVVMVKSPDGGRAVEVHRSDRWVEVSWSPDSRWLLVTDHWDGHGANVRIYEVPENAAAAGWQVQEVYATPGPTQYDCRWSLVEWRVKEGSVLLKCDYRSSPDGVVDGKAAWVSKRWDIPLDYP